MKLTFTKIYILIFILALGGLGFWGYKVIRKQYNGSSDKTASDQNQNSSQNNNPTAVSTTTDNSLSSNDTATSNNSDAPTSSTSASAPQTNINDKNDTQGNMLAHITTEQCNSNCSAFASDLQLLEYCQQVCGIIPVKNVTSCAGQSGIEKDYCLKDLAVAKSDASICDQISDVNVKQTCQNRIEQDVIEGN